jgi:UDP-N-acetylglucosamine transferase subunit ALG13
VFIGAISRFVQTGNTPPILFPGQSRPVNLVIILSGPEPQRSYLQRIVLKQVLSLNSTCAILQGIPGRIDRVDLTSCVTMYSHLPLTKLRQLLLSAENVICRAGYTSIMDLFLMQKKAMIIPTPGQTEQEYLARYLSGKGLFLSCSQDELDIKSALVDLKGFKPEFNVPADDLLGQEIREFI